MEDAAPELLNLIKQAYEKGIEENELLAEISKMIQAGEGTYSDANAYASEVGKILSNAYQENLSSAVLPDGKMYYNIGKRVIEPTMVSGYNTVADMTALVQTGLNKKAGIGIRAIRPELNQDRIDGIINRLSSESNYDDVSWILDAPVQNFTRSIVDDSIKINAEFHGKAGMMPRIIRKSSGHCCKWCNEVAGVYTYPDVPKDVYRRHENCDCTVEYDPGTGKRQNIWTKGWADEVTDEKMMTRKNISNKEVLKKLSENIEDVTKEYIQKATPGKGQIIYDEGYNKHKHEKEIKIAEWIHKTLGGNIKLLNEATEVNVKTPDYKWNEKLWDLKTTTTAKSANSAVRHGLKQIKDNPGGIILDYTDNEVVLDELVNILQKRLTASSQHSVDIMVLQNGKKLIVLRYKK